MPSFTVCLQLAVKKKSSRRRRTLSKVAVHNTTHVEISALFPRTALKRTHGSVRFGDVGEQNESDYSRAVGFLLCHRMGRGGRGWMEDGGKKNQGGEAALGEEEKTIHLLAPSLISLEWKMEVAGRGFALWLKMCLCCCCCRFSSSSSPSFTQPSRRKEDRRQYVTSNQNSGLALSVAPSFPTSVPP